MQEYLDVLTNPPMLHAIAGHTPIALAMLGVPLVILAVLIRSWRALHWFSLLTYAIVAGGAYGAMLSGEGAMDVAPNTLSAEVWQDIEAHEELGEIAWIGALVTFVILAVMLINHDRLRLITGVLAIIASMITAGIIAVTAHRGGMLVYEHGVGTGLVNNPPQKEPATPPAPVPEGADYEPELWGNPELPERLEDIPVTLPPGERGEDATETPDIDSGDAYEPELQGHTEMPVPLEELPAVPPIEKTNTPAIDPEPAAAAKVIVYATDIEPILAQHCYECHEEVLPDGELDMTNWDNMLAGGEKGGPTVVPGKPEESAIIKYLEGTFQPQMPYKKDPLDRVTIQLLRDWIAQGAQHPQAK